MAEIRARNSEVFLSVIMIANHEAFSPMLLHRGESLVHAFITPASPLCVGLRRFVGTVPGTSHASIGEAIEVGR
jgi:hypothetical protein